MAADLPLSDTQATRVAKWMTDNFDAKLAAAVKGTAFGKKHLCGIVCQETAYVWLGWLKRYDATTILARCVFDASGDASGTSRSAFPKNTAAFKAKYGATFTNMLIGEANFTRKMRGYGDKQWVYKGYGLFQYDLQKIDPDRSFFEDRKWGSFDECLSRAMAELNEKLKATGDVWTAIERYNGSGPKAVQYRQNVKHFTTICSAVTGEP
jgi:hypothetical protein